MFTFNEQSIISQAIHIIESKLVTGPVFTSPKAVSQFCQIQIGALEHEVFSVLFLTNQHALIKFETLFTGTIDGSSVYPREVAKAALKHNAAAVIITHNHPSGVSEPSHADKQITERLFDALGLIGVRVLDHIIVSPGGTYSFSQFGIL